MALSQTAYVERVVIVMAPDGSFKGAHQERLETLKNGAEVLSARMLPAEPLSAEALVRILPDAAALSAQVLALQAQLETASADSASAAAAKATAEGERDTARQRVAELEALLAPPAGCTDIQGRLALKGAGLLTSVENAVALMPLDDERRIYWDRATFWREDSPVIAQFAAMLGIDASGKAALFAAARAIQV